MKQAIVTNLGGLYTDVTIVEDNVTGVLTLFVDEEIIGYQVAVAVPEGFYLPKWDFDNEVWIEGKTQEEIDEINSYVPPESNAEKIARLEAENSQLKEDGLMTMEAIAEVYEMLLTLQGGA